MLILDEAMSRLDAQTNRRVQKVMREAFHDCTVLIVAHRVCSLLRLLPKRKLIIEQLDTIIDFVELQYWMLDVLSLTIHKIFLLEKVYSIRCILAQVGKSFSVTGCK